jgi:beta-galactosidase
MRATPFFAVCLAALALWGSRAPAELAQVSTAAVEASPASSSGRERLLMDAGWRFALGRASDPDKDFLHATGYFSYLAKAGYGDGPAAARFDDRAWRVLDLPHDWAVEAGFSSAASPSHGFKAIGRGFPEASIGWYRRTFFVPATDLGRRIAITFDGVYRDSAVWINGFYVGREPSGYLGFHYDLTDYLRYGEDNVISVRVDATLEEGWFYEGAGIYRHVWLTKTAPIHVAADGTFVTTVLEDEAAHVTAQVTIANDAAADASVAIEQAVVDAEGSIVVAIKTEDARVAAGATADFSGAITVPRPKLWSLESPYLYKLVTTVRQDGAVIDRYETTFGMRTIRFDPNAGFFLNGKRVTLKGTNNHQDHAGVGIALPDALQTYRIARLKEMGANAYRASHNPPTPELLDACDRLGMLVVDEHRLMGSNPAQLDDLARLMRRDRNHPSVILWSLGNEEWALEGNVTGARVAATMQALAHRLDPTRLATVAISGGREHGISTVMDVMGYNYISAGAPDTHRALYPNQPGVGTEETTTQGTRGIYRDDRERAHLAPLENGSSGGNCETGWQHYAARPYLAGLFFWTGFDYRGEPTPFGWPAISSQFGILDTCGFPKDSFYYLQAWWTDRPVVHLSPHWTWPGREGQAVEVRCDGNCDAVELALNGRALGRKEMPRNGHLAWSVPYEPGVLQARCFKHARVVASDRVETAGRPTAIQLVADRAQLAADGEDVALVAVQVVDARGQIVPTAAAAMAFELHGPGRVLGVGNGDPSSHEADRAIEGIALRSVHDWRGRIAPAGTLIPSAAEEALPPLTALGNWRAPLPKASEVYDLAAVFVLDALSTDSELQLYLPALGARTTLWVNGHEQARDIDTSMVGPALRLDRGQLVTGTNRVQLVVTPFADGRNHIPDLTELGSVQIRTPAPPWRRSAFGGLAQVILQAGAPPGTITLTATAQGLASGKLVLEVRPAALRPALPAR